MDLLKKTQSIIGLSKHLCGAATDLTLRCILRNQEEPKTSGVFIALCCHHRCEWNSFVGKNFFYNHGLNKKDFLLITKLASYAICGTGMSRERRKIIINSQNNEPKVQNIVETARRREEIGLICKRFLDYARLEFMRANNFEGRLKYYVSNNVTLENVAMILKRK